MNEDMPGVSIVIAAYNAEATMRKCLNSIEKIDYPKSNLEVIVVDNNSNDNTAAIARKCDVHLITELRQGAAYARNTGVEKSSKEIIVFVDADSYVGRDWLKLLVRPFEDVNVGAVGGGIVPDSPGIISDFFSHSIYGRYPCLGRSRVEQSYASCNLAIRHEWLDKFRFDPRFKIAEDLDLTMRLTDAGCRIIYQPEAIVRHEHPRTFVDFLKYWLKWAAGRKLLCDKYPRSRTCFLMRFQIFTLYYATMLIATLWSAKLSLILAAAPVAFVGKYALKDYSCDKRIFASLVVAPVLNLMSLPIASLAFAYEVWLKRRNV